MFVNTVGIFNDLYLGIILNLNLNIIQNSLYSTLCMLSQLWHLSPSRPLPRLKSLLSHFVIDEQVCQQDTIPPQAR